VPLTRRALETRERLLRQLADIGLVVESQEVQRSGLHGNRIHWTDRCCTGHVGRGPGNGETADSDTVDGLRLQELHLLKIGDARDAVGVLSGALDTLWRLRPMVFAAAADDAELAALADRARQCSYRCWRMDVALFNSANFNRRDDDIFDGILAHAILAIPEEIEVDVALKHCREIP